ncbi:MFS general substrate transporter [Clavulina sp. PMI_390]|nr:MFS general substrate transporter [Clavulina sp. PMI_390]
MSREYLPLSPVEPIRPLAAQQNPNVLDQHESEFVPRDLDELAISQEPNFASDGPLRSPSTSSINDLDEDDNPSPTKSSEPTPLPRTQMAILLFLLLTEPISGFVIYPFVTKLVGELGITDGNESAVGYYVGFIESLFYIAQGLTVLQWGRLSDSIGRRPVILLGTLGLALSLLAFGFTTTSSSMSKSFSPWGSFAWVVFSRSLAGFLDGNVGVVKTMLGELTDESNRARAFSLFPTTWIVGATMGPLVGGALEHPAERFPAIFGPEKARLWTTYPYLLPCLLASIFCSLMFLVGWAFLRETLSPSHPAPSTDHGDYEALPQDSPIEQSSPISPADNLPQPKRAPTMREVLTRPVVIAVLNYGTLAMLDIAYFSIMTVFFAVPISSGGLGLPPSLIGIIFATLGIASGGVQLLVFPIAHKLFGSKRLLRISIGSFMLVFPTFIGMHLAARANMGIGDPTENEGVGKAKGLLVWMGVFGLVCLNPLVDMGYSCSFMFVTSSSPSPSHLGSINGLAQTLVSMVRAFGPAGSTALFSLSTKNKWMGGYGIYAIMMGLTVAALGCTGLLPDDEKQALTEEKL